MAVFIEIASLVVNEPSGLVGTDLYVQTRVYRPVHTHLCVQARWYRFAYKLVRTDVYVQTRVYRLVGRVFYVQTRRYKFVYTDSCVHARM